MKHAGQQALDELASLLAEVRLLPGLVERKPGIFYRRGQAYLHFHEDPAGLFADVKLGAEPKFERFRVSTPQERQALLMALQTALQAAPR